MQIRNLVPQCKWLVLLFLVCALDVTPASAQTKVVPGAPSQNQQSPVINMSAEDIASPAARESELRCGGFITQSPASARYEIVGSDDEQEQRLYGEGDLLYVNAGASDGVKVGQEFSVERPRGRFKSTFSEKKGTLGIYTQELGLLRVVKVRDHVSVALVTRSCNALLNGDLLRDASQRVSPARRQDETVLDRFAEPTGKGAGHIVLARDGREVLTRDDVVFIDLGTEDNVKQGDYLTVFRPVDRGNIVRDGNELAANARRGFESAQFRGGKLSNQAQRLEDPNQGMLNGATVKSPAIRKRRPAVPRKIVGEMVVLQVEGRTATAVITRVTQEVHTGDSVEIQ